jgi:hypothetical protein
MIVPPPTPDIQVKDQSGCGRASFALLVAQAYRVQGAAGTQIFTLLKPIPPLNRRHVSSPIQFLLIHLVM